MKRIPSIALLLAGAVPVAQADTLRCGNKLIQEGDTAGKVLERCGEPQNKQVITTPVRAVNASGYSFETGATATVEIWRYGRGSGKFPALVTIEGGVIKKIEYER
jgi:hypothetical protein